MIPVVPDDTNTNISGNSYLFCRLAEAEALLVGDDSNIGFGSTCSAAIDKVSTDFGDAFFMKTLVDDEEDGSGGSSGAAPVFTFRFGAPP